ncbi:MAG: PHP domain-containing protein [Candidatus Cloacimonetes bacterium]|nr:PHP domain-containing protein [Candidatus Cloacimonadota bacterium]
MHWYKADLHIHSVLSPCGDLAMSPHAMMKKAGEMELDIIAVTDHNTVSNCQVYYEVARKYGLHLLYGLEVQTAEEIHIITLFDDLKMATAFGNIIYDSLLPIANDPEFFGDQVVVDAEENIIKFENKALINSSLLPLDEIVKIAEQHNAFIFPAHVDAPSYSIIGQLGVIPDYLNFIACGITAKADPQTLISQYPQLANYSLIKNSDAHYLDDIGSGYTEFYLDSPTVEELKKACRSECGRTVYVK